MLTTFRDAAFAINTYPLTVLDCCRAFYRVHCLRHFVYSSFDIFKHDHLSKLENGDISWIIPGKFIAFSGPVSTPRELSPGVFALSPEGYVPLFKSLGVTCIIRFNKKCYDRNIFVRSGIKHVDLYYEDGGNPTDAILQVHPLLPFHCSTTNRRHS
jgi:cell division cycle 14